MSSREERDTLARLQTPRLQRPGESLGSSAQPFVGPPFAFEEEARLLRGALGVTDERLDYRGGGAAITHPTPWKLRSSRET